MTIFMVKNEQDIQNDNVAVGKIAMIHGDSETGSIDTRLKKDSVWSAKSKITSTVSPCKLLFFYKRKKRKNTILIFFQNLPFYVLYRNRCKISFRNHFVREDLR